MPPNTENLLFISACAAYGLGFCFTFLDNENRWYRLAPAITGFGWILHTLSLAWRWHRIGHGPFINLFEILSSNLWSLVLVYLVFVGLMPPALRAAGRFMVPVLVLLLLWLLLTPPRDSHLPATYDTIWLYFHVLSGKIFLGLLLLATGLAIAEALRRLPPGERPAAAAAQSPSYRLLAFAFCFESLMLVFGAVWAQDAWGRYWAWDPLETWAFLTWLSVIFVLHWRLNFSRRRIYAALVAACFVLAFLTFFGVPFVSTAPHKGMV